MPSLSPRMNTLGQTASPLTSTGKRAYLSRVKRDFTPTRGSSVSRPNLRAVRTPESKPCHSHNNSSFFGFRPILLSALMFAAIVETACAQNKSVGQDIGTAGTSRGMGVVVTVDGETADDPDIMISLNPCKGETPGDVLGVSEQV